MFAKAMVLLHKGRGRRKSFQVEMMVSLKGDFDCI